MVHIKKVEISGFKSFGFRNTAINFEPGMISLSGPNGSGKSNILNAIIFATGENRSRIMGRATLRDLIHDIDDDSHGNGGASRPRGRPRTAKSSIHFDNTDRKIPVASDTVTITRELDESGDNTYYLNKKKTNRKYILDILDVARAGHGHLNTVQQGTVTKISEYTADERRRSIEDLIGISTFDERKEDAMAELQSADIQLDKVSIKMNEIKEQIDNLDEERNLAQRFKLIERSLQRYSAIEAANQLRSLTDTHKKKGEEMDGLQEQAAKLNSEIARINKEYNKINAAKNESLNAANTYAQAKSSLDAQISQSRQRFDDAESTLSLSTIKLKEITSKLEQLDGEIKGNTNSLNHLDVQIREMEEQRDEADRNLQEIKAERQQADSERRAILDEQAGIVTKNTETDKTIKSLTAKRLELTGRLLKSKQDLSGALERVGASSAKLANVKQSIGHLESIERQLCTLMKNLDTRMSALKTRCIELEGDNATRLDNLGKLSLILEKSTEAVTKHKSKLNTVKEFMHEDYTVAKLRENAAALGIVGTVYEMFAWDDAYERPVLAASSDWIKALVVRDFATLLGIAEAARLRGLPKFKIISLDVVGHLKTRYTQQLPTPPQGLESGEYLGILADHIRCDPKYAQLQIFLFGGIILAGSSKSAAAASKLGYNAVTMSGEYFEARGGPITIDINSRISRLTRLISMSSDVDELSGLIRLARSYQKNSRKQIEQCNEKIRHHSEKVSGLAARHVKAEATYQHLSSRLGSARDLRGQLQQRISGADSEIESIKSAIDGQESEGRLLDNRIRLAEQEYVPADKQALLAERLTEISTAQGVLETKNTDASTRYTRISTELGGLRKTQNTLISANKSNTADMESYRTERPTLEENIRKATETKAAESDNLTRLRNEEQQLIANSGTSIGDVKEYDRKLGRLGSERETLKATLHSLERKSDAIGRELAAHAATMEELKKSAEGLRPVDAAIVMDTTSIIAELTAEHSDISSELNYGAHRKYVEITDGYRKISSRRNSLEDERNSIVNFINSIEEEKRQTFLDAFVQIDREIRRIFKMTGGEAWLELQDENNIFKSGISYLVQFKDKPKQESASISGGEKTLAAVVFVLALQRLQPSPFYLFDELDAHLDALNAEQLSSILKECSHNSQFIVVSLKDTVVEKADLKYGVFPRGGVSHVINYRDRKRPKAVSPPESIMA